MEPVTATAVGTFGTVATTKALEKLIENITQAATGQAKELFKRWRADTKAKKMSRRLGTIRKVKTIWQFDKAVDLYSFYYPSKVIVEGATREIRSIAELTKLGNIVIEGTVGQGKSMYLRHLCAQEIYRSEVVPVFVEMRLFTSTGKLTQMVCQYLDSIHLGGDPMLFDHLASTKRLALCLDGFDEVKMSARPRLISQIENLATKYEAMPIVISSRPENGIDKSALFRVVKLAPLNRGDVQGLIEKLTDDTSVSTEIRIAIDRRKEVVHNLLTTPLMVTLLVMSYKNEKEIPETVADFYEAVFNTLLVAHDKLKPTFRRPRRSKLTDEQLRHLFDAFCFQTRKQQVVTLTQFELEKTCQQAKKLSQVDCDSKLFIEDISRITCLLLQEGESYHFIHKSVSEFHASSFVARAPDRQAEIFYGAIRRLDTRTWHQELDFLQKMDKYRFLKYFLIPDLEARSADAAKESTSDPYFALALAAFSSVRLEFTFDGRLRKISFGEDFTKCWAITKHDNELAGDLSHIRWKDSSVPPAGSNLPNPSAQVLALTRTVSLQNIIQNPASRERIDVLAAAKRIGQRLRNVLTDAQTFVANTEAVASEFDVMS